MLKLIPNPTFIAPVDISVPGQAQPAQIEVEFKYMKRKQAGDWFARLQSEPTDDASALAEVIVSWKWVDIDYSQDALAELLENYPSAARDIFMAFSRELTESKVKN